MGLVAISAVMVAIVLAFSAVVFGIAQLMLRVGYPKVGLTTIVLGAGYLVYTSATALIGCAEEPKFVPLTGELSGEGYYQYVCDGPGGFASYIYGFIAAPIGAIVLGVIAWRCWKSLSQTRPT